MSKEELIAHAKSLKIKLDGKWVYIYDLISAILEDILRGEDNE